MNQSLPPTYPGFFLTLEGGDGAGKSTLITGLCGVLQELNIPILTTHEPGGCSLGDTMRTLALSAASPLDVRAELALFLAARAQHVTEKILPALKKGCFVICDRFHDSTIAYQGYGRELGPDYIANLSLFFAQQLMPECTLYCDIDPDAALSRIKNSRQRVLDRLEQEPLDYHARVHAGFCALAKQHPERIHRLNAKQSKATLLKEAAAILQPCIEIWKARREA